MIPLHDDNPTHIRPYVTWGLVAANVILYLLQWANGKEFTYAYTMVPAELLTGRDFGPVRTALEPYWLTLFSSMFLHGSLLHLGGNMLYLWIFGNNIEDSVGHLRFLVFYLICGVLAGLAHVFATQMMDPRALAVPTLGASGAVAGFFSQVMQVPAKIVLGIWFLLEVFRLIFMSQQASVAFAAHVGGFVAGFALVSLFGAKRGGSYGFGRKTRWQEEAEYRPRYGRYDRY
jgi:membrane associated rhomboid family serine protease